MVDYTNTYFEEILREIRLSDDAIISAQLNETDCRLFVYFLTRNFYYAVIVDDYPITLKDKPGLLEALYYQVKLVTVYNLNWDAIKEGLEDIISNMLDFEGVVLIFKNGKNIQQVLPTEMNILKEIVNEVGKGKEGKRVKMLVV